MSDQGKDPLCFDKNGNFSRTAVHVQQMKKRSKHGKGYKTNKKKDKIFNRYTLKHKHVTNHIICLIIVFSIPFVFQCSGLHRIC